MIVLLSMPAAIMLTITKILMEVILFVIILAFHSYTENGFFFSECPNYAQGSNTLFYCIYLTLACIL